MGGWAIIYCYGWLWTFMAPATDFQTHGYTDNRLLSRCCRSILYRIGNLLHWGLKHVYIDSYIKLEINYIGV